MHLRVGDDIAVGREADPDRAASEPLVGDAGQQHATPLLEHVDEHQSALGALEGDVGLREPGAGAVHVGGPRGRLAQDGVKELLPGDGDVDRRPALRDAVTRARLGPRRHLDVGERRVEDLEVAERVERLLYRGAQQRAVVEREAEAGDGAG